MATTIGDKFSFKIICYFVPIPRIVKARTFTLKVSLILSGPEQERKSFVTIPVFSFLFLYKIKCQLSVSKQCAISVFKLS